MQQHFRPDLTPLYLLYCITASWTDILVFPCKSVCMHVLICYLAVNEVDIKCVQCVQTHTTRP